VTRCRSASLESESEYTVDLREAACTCPDFQHRDEVEECKHVRRCRIEFGQVDTDRLRDQIAKTAEDLEANAEKLESKAQELTKAATELRNALDRLEHVSQ
jgi:hypothetical protein